MCTVPDDKQWRWNTAVILLKLKTILFYYFFTYTWEGISSSSSSSNSSSCPLTNVLSSYTVTQPVAVGSWRTHGKYVGELKYSEKTDSHYIRENVRLDGWTNFSNLVLKAFLVFAETFCLYRFYLPSITNGKMHMLYLLPPLHPWCYTCRSAVFCVWIPLESYIASKFLERIPGQRAADLQPSDTAAGVMSL